MSKELKEMEYSDAPSGYVTMYHYKEPFMPFEYQGSGFGYQGALLFDGSTDKIQCHLCGDWFGALPHHLMREHNIRASAYKNLVGLRQTSALISEGMRKKLIASGLDKRLQNLRAGGKKSEETKKKISDTLKKRVRESENEKGTCPYQLIDRLQKRAKELGRCPTNREITFETSLCNVYGTFSNACLIAGLTPLKSGQTLGNHYHTKYPKEEIVVKVRNYWIENNKLPKPALFQNKTEYQAYLKHKKEIIKEVLTGTGKFHDTPVKVYYTKDELLDIIKVFIKNNDRLPSISDCKRGLLPHASRYCYHFGTFKNALDLIV
jgi:hypothetical protein